jgi:hypothetical protein
VDAKTKVIYKRSSKSRYAQKWASGTHQWFPSYKKANDAIIELSFSQPIGDYELCDQALWLADRLYVRKIFVIWVSARKAKQRLI